MLTDAAINCRSDKLQGLKENVIIGKLIPAGTGINRYRNIQVQPTEEARAAAYTIPSYEDQYYSPDFGQATGAAVPLDDYGYSRLPLVRRRTTEYGPGVRARGPYCRLYERSPGYRPSARRRRRAPGSVRRTSRSHVRWRLAAVGGSLDWPTCSSVHMSVRRIRWPQPRPRTPTSCRSSSATRRAGRRPSRVTTPRSSRPRPCRSTCMRRT